MDTNWIAFALAVVTGIAIGALWFGPRTFFPPGGKHWVRHLMSNQEPRTWGSCLV